MSEDTVSQSCKDIATLIDHSLLQPNATDRDLATACEIARRWDVAVMMVRPYHVKKASQILRGSTVPVATTVGFPHGCNASLVKVYEAEVALDEGAVELDMVANIGAIKSGDWGFAERDIAAVVSVARRCSAVVKVIIETCFLDEAEKVRACEAVKTAGADFVKTSTGYGPAGANVDDVELMRRAVGPDFGVKASGGIRTLDVLLQLLNAGANRIGTSSTAAIMAECHRRE
ncbi:MAG: deoxyribose-phosphate aldolase [Chloroflexi bacterium]|nr:deoxyribose-phosphate aldolase [Chloroflexota bacterium]